MSGAGRGEPAGSFIRGDHLAFVLGDPGHGASFVLGQGAAESAVAVGTDISRGSVGEALRALRTDAEQNGTVDYRQDGTPIRGDRKGHTRSSRTASGVAVEPGFEMGGE